MPLDGQPKPSEGGVEVPKGSGGNGGAIVEESVTAAEVAKETGGAIEESVEESVRLYKGTAVNLEEGTGASAASSSSSQGLSLSSSSRSFDRFDQTGEMDALLLLFDLDAATAAATASAAASVSASEAKQRQFAAKVGSEAYIQAQSLFSGAVSAAEEAASVAKNARYLHTQAKLLFLKGQSHVDHFKQYSIAATKAATLAKHARDYVAEGTGSSSAKAAKVESPKQQN
jgi:hypothetical protein